MPWTWNLPTLTKSFKVGNLSDIWSNGGGDIIEYLILTSPSNDYSRVSLLQLAFAEA
jgi:hypothetical protein